MPRSFTSEDYHSFHNYHRIFMNEELTRQWLIENHLMQIDRVCACTNHMNLIKASNGIWRFRCHRCGTTASWKADTYFSGKHYPISSILFLALCWWLSIPITAACCFTALSPEGVSLYYRDFRRCSTLMLLHQDFVLGGHEKIVEIDECCLTRRKYQRGLIPLFIVLLFYLIFLNHR